MSTAQAESSTIHVRVKDDIREKAIANANAVGIPLSTLINAFLIQFASEGRVPFEIKVPAEEPNERVYQALQEVESGQVNKYKNSSEMFEKLGIEL